MFVGAKTRATLFKVKVGERVLCRTCPWSEVEKLKEKVKLFSSWQPSERMWVARVEGILKHSEEALSALREAFGGEGEKLVSELLQRDRELRDRWAASGELLILPVYDSPLYWRLLKRCAKREPLSIWGELVNYYRLDLSSALEIVLEWGASPESAGEALLDLLTPLDPLLSQAQRDAVRRRAALLQPPESGVAIRGWGMGGALAVASLPLSEEAIAGVESALTVDYHRQRVGGSGIELVCTRLKLVKVLSRRVLKVPYALVPTLKEVLSELGYCALDEVDWPVEKLLEPEPRFVLYTFQEEALEAWRKASYRGAIVMPTGAGKTFVALAAIATLKVPTLVCVTTVELAKQWVKRLHECLGLKAGVLVGGEKRVERVTVATYHSAVKALPDIYDKFGFVVYDEGHHLPAETFKEIALRLKAKYTMVLSATPERSDGNESLIYKVGGGPVYATSYLELVARGLLAPLQLEVIPVQLSEEEAASYARVEETSEDARRAAELIKVAARARAKVEALREIVSRERGKIIVFCQFVDQAREAYEAVREIESRAALITGLTSKTERLNAFEGFRKGSVRVLVTTTVLDEGIDVPDADVAVILSGTGQVRQMVQRVGRVLRWTPGKVAKVYEIIAAETIEEALSRARSIYKVISPREVEAALKAALTAYERMGDAIEKYMAAKPEEKERMLEELRARYVGLWPS